MLLHDLFLGCHFYDNNHIRRIELYSPYPHQINTSDYHEWNYHLSILVCRLFCAGIEERSNF
jgi:hypothetical protein